MPRRQDVGEQLPLDARGLVTLAAGGKESATRLAIALLDQIVRCPTAMPIGASRRLQPPCIAGGMKRPDRPLFRLHTPFDSAHGARAPVEGPNQADPASRMNAGKDMDVRASGLRFVEGLRPRARGLANAIDHAVIPQAPQRPPRTGGQRDAQPFVKCKP